MNNSHITIAALLLLAMPQHARATEETTDPYNGMLLGDLGGQRPVLSNAGIDVSLEYKADLWSNVSGGLARGSDYLDNLDVKFAVNGAKLFGLQGNDALIYFLNNNGGQPNERRVGSTQGIDNIEAPGHAFKLYEAWDQQSFFDGKLSVLAGLHDLNSEFDETDLTANFLEPTMQIGETFGQSGLNGPSIFPTTSLALRVKFNPTEESYLMAAAFDGLPGARNDYRGTHLHLRSGDGALLVTEVGYAPKAPEGTEGFPDKIGIGAWTYTKRMDDLVDTDGDGNPLLRRMAGAYFLSSYEIYHDRETGHLLGGFLRAGLADGNTEQVDRDIEIGMVGHGWTPSRKDSEIGLAMTQAHNSDKYMQSGTTTECNEYILEAYYRDQLRPGISIQPDLHYVIHPDTDPAINNATVVGMRLDINL